MEKKEMVLDMEKVLCALDEVLDKRAKMIRLFAPDFHVEVKMEEGRPILEIFPFSFKVETGGKSLSLIQISKARDVLEILAKAGAVANKPAIRNAAKELHELLIKSYRETDAIVSGKVQVN